MMSIFGLYKELQGFVKICLYFSNLIEFTGISSIYKNSAIITRIFEF